MPGSGEGCYDQGQNCRIAGSGGRLPRSGIGCQDQGEGCQDLG
jgi:hypothetical protein